MKKAIKKTTAIVINGTTMLPIMAFLLFTNQNKELDKLFGILKDSIQAS